MLRKSSSEGTKGNRLWCALIALALVAASCGGSDTADSDADDDTSATTAASADDDAGDDDAGDDAGDDDDAADDDAGDDDAGDDMADVGDRDFAAMGPPTGEPITVGFVNTEGPAGLNFPEIRTLAESAVEYLNEHGGMGNRPIELETCIAVGSPESSQECAQELAGKGAEIVLLGLDLFPDYATYEASGIPLVGILPLFPADYASNAVYLAGGNVNTGAAMASIAVNHFNAESVSIISADNAGANGSELAIIASLEVAGIPFISIKGCDSETDAGFQGLVREAVSDDPDLLISLYGDAGCIGMMRGRAALGIDTPTLTVSICSAAEVLDVAGDDAVGWFFVQGANRPETPESLVMAEIAGASLGIDPADVLVSELGLGGLGPITVLTTAVFANGVASSGGDVTGQTIIDFAEANPNGDLYNFPDGSEIDCGAAANFPAVCTHSVYVGAYEAGGVVEVVPGLEAVSTLDFLP